MTEKPNIALLVMDTAKGSHLGCNGYWRNTSPNLDRLAEEGFNFRNAYSTTCWTHPSHASMFSGKHLHEHDITSLGQDVSKVDMELLANLNERGYSTYAFSNNGNISKENGWDAHFDHFFHMSTFGENEILMEARELNSPDTYPFKKYLGAVFRTFKKHGLKTVIKDLGAVAKKALQLEDDGAARTNRKVKKKLNKEPFFLFVNYTEPHAMFDPPHIYSQIFLDRPRYFSLLKTRSEVYRKYQSQKNKPTEEYKRIMKAQYDGEIRYLDKKISQLHRFLEKKFDDTILIVTSDHGEYIFEQNRTSHLSGIHREVLDVPLIIYGVEEGEEEETFSLLDLPELILNLPDLEYRTGKAGAEFAGITSATKNPDYLDKSDLEKFDVSMISALDTEDQIILKESEEKKNEGKFKSVLEELDFPEKHSEEIDEKIKGELRKLGYL